MPARLLTVSALALVLAFATAAPAQGAHHLLKVVEVYVGNPGHDNVEFVELMAASGGQNIVAGDHVRIYNASGTMIRDLTFTANVAVGTNQMSILVATSQAKTYFGMPVSDLTVTAGIPAAGGKACLEDPGNAALPVIDCVSWGTYAGPTTTKGDANPVPGGIPAGKSLQRNIDRGVAGVLENVADDVNSSSADFSASALVTPENNAGATPTTRTSATVDGVTTQLNVQASPGVTNKVVATKTTDVTLTDSGAPTLANAGCTAVDVDTVTCTGTSYTDTRTEDLADTITINGLGGRLDGGSGNDRLTGGAFGDDLLGGTGSDALLGGPGPDNLVGFDGDDVLDGGAGSDTLSGGANADTATYALRTEALDLSIDGAANDGSGQDQLLGVRDNIATDVERLIGGAGNDTLTGSTSSNTLDGGYGADTLDGGGGAGIDTVSYATRTAGVTVSLYDGTGGNADDGIGDSLTAIRNITGGSGADFLTANDLVNVIQAGPGVDIVNAGLGNDTVYINDGAADGEVNCNGGLDRFRADAVDVTECCETPF